MNRQLAITIFYISMLVLTLFMNKPYSYVILVISTTLILTYRLYEFWKSTNDNFEGYIVFRRQSKPVKRINIFLALIPTVGYFINYNKSKIIPIVFFWSIVLYDIIIAFMTNKLKPVEIIINDDKLIINNSFKTSRNLSELKSMSLNGLTDEIHLSFLNQRDISFNRNEFDESDIIKLKNILINSTNQNLIISDNLKL